MKCTCINVKFFMLACDSSCPSDLSQLLKVMKTLYPWLLASISSESTSVDSFTLSLALNSKYVSSLKRVTK